MPPHSREAERALLAAIIRDPLRLYDAIRIIGTGNLYVDAHRKIFQAMIDLDARGVSIGDIGTIADALKDRSQIEDVGGYPYLGSILEANYAPANVEYYAKKVRDKAICRGLIHVR